jgi:hypothetical protein
MQVCSGRWCERRTDDRSRLIFSAFSPTYALLVGVKHRAKRVPGSMPIRLWSGFGVSGELTAGTFPRKIADESLISEALGAEHLGPPSGLLAPWSTRLLKALCTQFHDAWIQS